jgi:hypothetical protein
MKNSKNTKFQTRISTPTAMNIVGNFDSMTGLKLDITSDELNLGLTNFYYGITPVIFVIENIMDYQEVLNGNMIINALYSFIKLDMTYPINGTIQSLQGKKYSELSALENKIFENEITIHILMLKSKDNNPEEEFFRDMVNNLKKLH